MTGATGGGEVCVVGSINMDLVVRAPRLPAAGETLLGGPFRTFPGGKGANQAVAAARMGARVRMVGAVGEDAYGAQLRALLDCEGIDVGSVAVHAGAATGVALITVDAARGENTIVVAGGANMEVSAAEVEGALRERERWSEGRGGGSAGVLLMQLELPLGTVAWAARLGREQGMMVVLNAAPAAALPREMLGDLDVLIVNRGEAAALSGLGAGEDAAALGEALGGLGVGTVVVTLGSEGALVWSGGRTGPVGAARVRAVDTVGAGDAFAGALAAALAEGRGIEGAARLASAAGGLATTREGAIPSLPRREDVERLAVTLA